ncbi:Ig-like domain-containing protein [Planomicrobium sp. CPCC 101079]|uniref:Ig-like domain-containing protein n=1 Tax=Planomicrobium sp. CPCC 101079 TaxID=2599618 RepID=UPI001647F767|nr:Ig-like domain-containing protein [Planomicrobium sp. CPCC 101079]
MKKVLMVFFFTIMFIVLIQGNQLVKANTGTEVQGIVKTGTTWSEEGSTHGVPPEIPYVEEITDKTTKIFIVAEPGSQILITSNNRGGYREIGRGIANYLGEFSISISRQKPGTKILVTASNNAGYTSEAKEMVVIDTTAPEMPIIDPIYEITNTITGRTESDSKVYAFIKNEKVGEAIGIENLFSISIDKQLVGTSITLYAVDAAGNKSASKTVKVMDRKASLKPTINPVYENSKYIAGKAETHSIVYAYERDKYIGETIVANGIYSIAINGHQIGSEITLYAVDSTGTESYKATAKVQDRKASLVPTINIIYDTSKYITGKAETNSKVYAYEGEIYIGEAKVDKGSYSIAINGQRVGSEITLYAVDIAGTKSYTTTAKVIDRKATLAPTVNPIYDNTYYITGKAEINSTIYAYVGKSLLTTEKVVKGVYSFAMNDYEPAGSIITVYAIDTEGNKSNITTVIVADKTAPRVPTINAVGDNATALTGKVESGAKVYAYVGSKKVGETTAAKGTYSIKIAKQKNGTSISIYAVDAAGNKSASKTIKVIDKTAPSVPSVNTVSDKSTTISGKAESGAKVYAYVGKKKLGEVTAKSGSYSLKIAKQKAGTSISVYAIDPAKNKSGSKTVKVIDKTAPAAPSVNKVTSKSTTITGKGEKAATVLIYNGSKKIGQGTVDSKGSFKVKIKAQKKGSSLKVCIQDKAGNKSGSKTLKVN